MAASGIAGTVARAFLERRGFEVLGSSEAGGREVVVARDEDGTVAFVEASASDGPKTGFPGEADRATLRRRLETAAALWMAENGTEDAKVRFDLVAAVPVSEGRFFIRHHIDALCRE